MSHAARERKAFGRWLKRLDTRWLVALECVAARRGPHREWAGIKRQARQEIRRRQEESLMAVLTSEELEKLRAWIAGMTDGELERNRQLTAKSYPGWQREHRQTWFRLGRLLEEENEWRRS